jgi:hypothetical protein
MMTELNSAFEDVVPDNRHTLNGKKGFKQQK